MLFLKNKFIINVGGFLLFTLTAVSYTGETLSPQQSIGANSANAPLILKFFCRSLLP
jgi:hypothetical protein